MVTNVGHPAFAARGVGRTPEFYARLGIGEACRLHHDDGSLKLVYLHVSGDRFIEVFPGGPPPDSNRTQSFMHVCLLTDDLQATVERLRRSGAPIDREPAGGLDGNLQPWTRDPDGNQIEFMHHSEGSPQRRATRSSGRNGA